MRSKQRKFCLAVAAALVAVLAALAAACSSSPITVVTTTTAAPTTTAAGDSDSDGNGDGSGNGSGDGNDNDNGNPTTTAGSQPSINIVTTTPSPSTTEPPTTTPGDATTTTYELADAAFNAQSKVTTVGIDGVYFGMTHTEAAARARTTWDGLPEGVNSLSGCIVVTPSNGPDGINVWLWNGHVERIDLTNPDIRTRSGFGIGTELETLQDALGEQLELVVHEDDSKTATFVPVDEADSIFRIVFELDQQDEVVSYRAGRESLINRSTETC